MPFLFWSNLGQFNPFMGHMYPLYAMTCWGKYGGTYNPEEGFESES